MALSQLDARYLLLLRICLEVKGARCLTITTPNKIFCLNERQVLETRMPGMNVANVGGTCRYPRLQNG